MTHRSREGSSDSIRSATLGEIAEDVDWLMRVLAFLCSLIGIQLCMKKEKRIIMSDSSILTDTGM
jgi:hypothetical protein